MELTAKTRNLHPDRQRSGYGLLRATADRALYTAPLGLSAGIEGILFASNMGGVTTPIAHNTALSNVRPAHWIRVPAHTAIIPVYAKVTIESTGITIHGEISTWISQNDVGNGTSTASTAGPLSINTVTPAASTCTARQAATADTTTPTNPLELSRYSFAADGDNQHFEWNGHYLGVYPIVRGPATWAVCTGGFNDQVFSQMVWMECPASKVS